MADGLTELYRQGDYYLLVRIGLCTLSSPAFSERCISLLLGFASLFCVRYISKLFCIFVDDDCAGLRLLTNSIATLYKKN